MHSGSSFPASFTETVLDAIPWFMCLKTKRFAVKFRCILEVLWLRVLQKKFWAQFHDLCVHKRSCLPWSSDAFWTFSASKFYRESSGQIFTIYVFKNEAVCSEVHTHFASSPRPRFTEKILDKFSRFMCSKTKLFALKFTHILQVICLQVLPKKFWVQFHILCVQKRICLLGSSDAFWKVSACKIVESCGHIFTIYVSCKQTFLTSTFCKNALTTFYNLHARRSLLGCLGELWSSWLSHFIRMLWIWTYLDYKCSHKLWRASVTLCETLWRKSWTGTSDMFWNIWTLKEWTDFVKFVLR